MNAEGNYEDRIHVFRFKRSTYETETDRTAHPHVDVRYTRYASFRLQVAQRTRRSASFPALKTEQSCGCFTTQRDEMAHVCTLRATFASIQEGER